MKKKPSNVPTTDELIWSAKKRVARQKRRLMKAKNEKEKARVEALLESDLALLEQLKQLKASTGR